MRFTLLLWIITASLGIISYLVRYNVVTLASNVPPPVATPEAAPPASTEEVESPVATEEAVTPPEATEEAVPAETEEAD